MIRILRKYGQEYEIARWAVRNSDDILHFRNHGYAYGFLSRFLTDPMNARVLRTVYAETRVLHDRRRLTDRELLDGLAWALVSGTVIIRIRLRQRYEPILLPAETPPPPPPLPRPAPARPPVAPAPAPAPPPAPEADVDAEAQAATLKAAAETGVPFCEKCERAKKKAQQKAPAP